MAQFTKNIFATEQENPFLSNAPQSNEFHPVCAINQNAPNNNSSLKQFRIFLKNIAPSITFHKLAEIISNFGKIIDLKLKNDPAGKFTSTAVVTFLNDEDAQYAMQQLNGIPIDGCQIQVQKFRERNSQLLNNRCVKVDNICLSMDSENLKNIFATYGRVLEVKILERTNNTLSAYVYFYEAGEAVQAVEELHGFVQPNSDQKLIVKYAKEREQKIENNISSASEPNGGLNSNLKCLLVMNIPSEWDENILSNLFGQFGRIISLNLEHKEKYQKKTCSIVYSDEISAKKGFQGTNGLVVDENNNKLIVKMNALRPPCKFFRQGQCLRAMNCRFSHER